MRRALLVLSVFVLLGSAVLTRTALAQMVVTQSLPATTALAESVLGQGSKVTFTMSIPKG